MDDASTIRLGVVQPHAAFGEDQPRMLEDALEYVAQAGAEGVDLLLFPETYPGPTTHGVRYEVADALAGAAGAQGVALVAGTTVKAPSTERAYHISCLVIDAAGEIKGEYRRTHPRGEVYAGLYGSGPFWDFDYRPGDDLPVFDLGWGTIGVSICSEVYVPEVARTLALKGAEVCLFPTGIMIDDVGFRESWQTLIRARAIENLMYTATTMNLFDGPQREAHCAGGVQHLPPADPETGLNAGHAMIASPEEVMGVMTGRGILTADLDLGYIRTIRATPEFPEGVHLPAPYATIPGTFNLRRPELTGELAAERALAFDRDRSGVPAGQL